MCPSLIAAIVYPFSCLTLSSLFSPATNQFNDIGSFHQRAKPHKMENTLLRCCLWIQFCTLLCKFPFLSQFFGTWSLQGNRNVAVYLANVLMWQYGPPELYSLITTWCNVVTGVAASRMLINTRRAVRVPQHDDIPAVGSARYYVNW